jgi:hypothetical protein
MADCQANAALGMVNVGDAIVVASFNRTADSSRQKPPLGMTTSA